MNDPKRWLEEPYDALSLERELVLAGKSIEPPAGADDQVWAGIVPLIGPPAGGGAGGAAGGGAGALAAGAGHGGALVAGKFFVLGAAVGVSATVAIQGVRSRHAPVHPAPITSVASPAGARPAVGEHALRPPELRTEALPAREPKRSPSASADSALPGAPNVPNALPAGTTAMPDLAPAEPWAEPAPRDNQLKQEATELAQAKRLLAAGQAESALTLLAQSAQRFPSGALGHEREALVVEALLRSGRRALAQERARSFLGRYPESPLAGRIRNLVGQQ